MSIIAFVKFALICFDALAWPLLALGYPLRASIQAIEANSISDTKKLVIYWVIFSLISLFEYAFVGILQRLPFWPYMKLTIVFWMMIPDFDGAFYVYNHFVHPFLCIDVQTIINWFKKQQEFVLKDNFLAEAHGPKALEKLISSKGTEPSILQNDIKPILLTEKKEVAPVNLGTEPSILQNDIKPVQLTEKKEVAPVNLGKEPSILQKDIKPVQLTVKREVAPVNLIPETEPNGAQTVNNMIKIPEVKGAAVCHSPEIPADKQVQKEWTCAMCQVTTTSENCLKSHLQGRRHRDACEAITKAKNQPSKGKVSSAPAVRVKHSDLPHEETQKHAPSCSAQASQMKQQSSLARNNKLPSNNTSTSSNAVNPKSGTSKSYPPKEEPKKLPNDVRGNQPKGGDNVQGQRQFQKKNAKTIISQFHCAICNISCGRSEDLNCHLQGRKHLARLQELNDRQWDKQSSVAKNNDLPSNNTSTSSNAVNPKSGTSKSYPPKEEPKTSSRNNVAGNQLKAGDNVQGQQQFQKKNAKKFQCAICNISCGRLEDLHCHLQGRKHLAQLQELNNLERGKLA